MDIRKGWVCKTGAVVLLVFLLAATASNAETPDGNSDSGSSEGIISQRRIESPETRKNGLGRSVRILLFADAATRALDGYSTARMLRNRCNGDLTVPVCNEEMFLPDFITRSSGRVYGYEGGVWLAQAFVVRRVEKHHPRVARLIPILDISTTLPFAVNNLRLPVNSSSK
jgi:hypothetical protein